MSIDHSPLSRKLPYDTQRNPDLLFPILRKLNRETLGFCDTLPFFGQDHWNHYEVSWINPNGKPEIAIAEMTFDCQSPHLIESKSMKLYFNSLNQTMFQNRSEVQATIQQDIESKIGPGYCSIQLHALTTYQNKPLQAHLLGVSIDTLDIVCDTYQVTPEFLNVENEEVREVLCSDLLKSNCLVTNQPDWSSVQIIYQGKKIHREGLLRYIVSFRNNNEFMENCIEKIFVHLMHRCKPTSLTVYGRCTRRGGIDINVSRSTDPHATVDFSIRLCRQ